MISTAVPKVLLAKTPRDKNNPAERERLAGHLDDVYQVGMSTVRLTGSHILASVGLGSSYFASLEQAVCLASYLHDLGKANAQFQRALTPGHQSPQALRHEWVSAWLPLKFPALGGWLFHDCTDEVRWAVLFAVLGHHLKLASGSELKLQQGSGDLKVTVFCEHRDFSSCLRSLAGRLQKTATPPELPQTQIDLLTAPLSELRNWLPEAQQWYQKASHDTRRFVSVIKALTIAADVAGSSVPKTGTDPRKWTEAVLKRVCLADELTNVGNMRLKGEKPREFQVRIAESKSDVVFTKAGCGSGKTVAAYLWAARNAGGRKLFFCYPTTGTATEGFRDYIIPAEMSAEAMLLHSRSECDLEYILNNRGDPDEGMARVEALAAWDIPLVVCTVDQVLGLVQNSRKPLFTFPSIGNGAFVFDEIHQYDDRLFGALLLFLDVFRGAPTLLMTASLPKSRLDAIREVLSKRGTSLEIIEGPAELELIPRYVLTGILDSPPWQQVSEVLGQGGKVLWVTNTVNRCIEFVEEAETRGLQPLPYHSRYRYCDRIRKHNAVIEAFRTPGTSVAITTQVCEVSLDISADLLITDLAPVPALIQRLGRLNRRVTDENPGSPKPAILLSPTSPRPYETTDLEIAQKWLEELGYGPLSQAALAATFENVSQSVPPPVKSAWFEGGPFSEQRPLRDVEATIPVIRSEDEPLCLDEQEHPITKEVTRYTIPMLLGPVASEISQWKRLSFVFVAPPGRIAYSEKLGAKWAEK